MTDSTIGSKLLALKARSGLSLPKIAKSGGYKNASSVQRYFDEDYDPSSLPGPVATKLIAAMVGFGDPPIERQDLIALTDVGFMLDRKFSPEGPAVDIRRARAPLIYCSTSYRTSADEIAGAPAIDAMIIPGNDPIRVFKKPEHLLHRNVDATFVSARAMSPRYGVGEIVFFEHERPAAAGQDVLIYLRTESEMPMAILCRLVAETADAVEIETLNPAQRHTVPAALVDSIVPALSYSEMLETANLA